MYLKVPRYFKIVLNLNMQHLLGGPLLSVLQSILQLLYCRIETNLNLEDFSQTAKGSKIPEDRSLERSTAVDPRYLIASSSTAHWHCILDGAACNH
eukprot:SAG31_NODE_1133_length_9745_cov_5.676343_1_plen_96_part_00